MSLPSSCGRQLVTVGIVRVLVPIQTCHLWGELCTRHYVMDWLLELVHDFSAHRVLLVYDGASFSHVLLYCLEKEGSFFVHLESTIYTILAKLPWTPSQECLEILVWGTWPCLLYIVMAFQEAEAEGTLETNEYQASLGIIRRPASGKGFGATN